MEKILSANIKSPKQIKAPPWDITQWQLNDNLIDEIKKSESPTALPTIAKLKINLYASATTIYDHLDRRLKNSKRYQSQTENWHFRLADGISIFTAVMTAIKTAIQIIKNNILIASTTLIICTDSFSSLQAIKTGYSTANPNLSNDITEKTYIHNSPSQSKFYVFQATLESMETNTQIN
jgi:hypothetical protein